MTYSDQQILEFRCQFSERRKRQLILAVILLPLVIGVQLMRHGEGGGTLEAIGLTEAAAGKAFFGLVVGALLFSFKNWRCPACDAYLGRSVGHKFCPKCGVKFTAE